MELAATPPLNWEDSPGAGKKLSGAGVTALIEALSENLFRLVPAETAQFLF